MKDLIRDAHGYVNNRGASKYWGVTTSKVGNSNIWVVNYKPRWSGETTVGFRAKNFTLKEVDAARIAAFLYESDQTDSGLDANIVSADGKYIFKIDVQYPYILREKRGNQKVYQFQPNLTLDFVADAVNLVSHDVLKQEAKEEVKLIEKALDELDKEVYTERQIIAIVTDAVLSGVLSRTGSLLLIGALEQAV